MRLNEKQHQIIAKANVQQLIERLGLEVIDTGMSVRKAVTNRVEGWMAEAAKSGPRVISTDAPVMEPWGNRDSWIHDMRTIHGPGWCPF